MNWFVRLITFNQAAGITLAPFGIYVKDEYINDQIMINHEKIHWKQQMEMLILFFYIWYLLEWFIRLFTNYKFAYYSLSFEREAYHNEDNLNYLNIRNKFAWLNYLKLKL